MNKKLKTVLIVGGALLIVGAALFGAAALMGASPVSVFGGGVYLDGSGVHIGNSGADAPAGGDWSTLGNVYAETGEYTCSDSAEKVDIGWLAGSVTVEPYDGDTVSLKETLSTGGAVEKKDAMGWGIREGALYIRYCGKAQQTDLPVKNLTVLLPRAMAANLTELELDTTSADMRVKDIVCRELDFSSTSGSLTASGITARSVDTETVSGDVELRGQILQLEADATSGAVRVQTTGKDAAAQAETISGDVELTGFARVETGTTGGGVTVESARITALRADTISGAVELRLAADAAFSLEFDTISGELDCGYATRQKGGRYVCGAGDAELQVSTTSGDLSVNPA